MLRRLFSTSTNGLDKAEIIYPYQPVPRWGHSAASINGKLYVWGGCMDTLPKVHSSAEKTSLLSQVEIFDPHSLLWERRMTTGSPPLGVYWNAYTNTDKYLYTFGGYCGHGNCYHNSVHQLDVTTLQWREVMAANPSDAPMKKWQCGMVSFTHKDTEFLCVFGGWGLLSASHKSTKHEFVADRSNLGCVWSNELHFFNLTKGTWDCPTTTGTQPPPCQGFTFTKVDSERVILFGGFQPNTRRRVNDVYILNLQTKHWIRLYNGNDPTVDWPMGRDDHSACIKNGSSPLFLTLGGVNNQFNTLADLWIMDVDSGKWKQVSAPQVVVGRRGHSTMVFSLAPRHFLLVIYGGIYEWVAEKSHREQPVVTETAVVELCESNGDWRVMCDERAVDQVPAITASNKQQQLNGHERRHMMENGFRHSTTDLHQISPREDRKSKKSRTNTMTLDRRAGASKQLEEAKKEIKMLQGQLIDAMNIVKKARRQGEESEAKNVQLEKKIEQITKDLSETQEKLSSYEEKAQEAQKTIDLQRKEIETIKKKSASPEPSNSSTSSNTGLILPDESLQGLWAVPPSDIQITQAELSRDKWSSVYVGSLRGLHIAAKCYKDTGSINEGIYYKAIKTALRIRHPNIIQFIGGTTNASNPIILTELMPTTLRMTLRQGPLPKRQVLSIASDISGALSYIHQLGIIHRDVNTVNVLLEPMGNSAWKAKLSECASSNFTSYLKLSSCSSPHPFASSNFLIFAAPEAKAPELYTPKTDIYGFGVVLLEMSQPSEGIVSITNGDLRPRLQRLAWPAMVTLIRACTCPAPSDRPSAFEVLQRLNSGGNSPPVVNSESLV